MRKKCLERKVRFNSVLTKKAILDKKVVKSIFCVPFYPLQLKAYE